MTNTCLLTHPSSPKSIFASSGPLSRCVLQCCPFPSTCSSSPIWCICLLNLWSARLQLSVPFLFELPPLPALVLCSPCGGSCRRVHDLLQPSIYGIFFQCALLPSTHSLRMLGSVRLGPSMLVETTALSAHRTSRPSCLTLFWQPPSNTSTFPSKSTHPLPILHSTLSVSLTTCHILLPFSPSVAHICGPPDFEPLHGPPNGMVSHSPICPRFSSDWVLQWVCRSCGSSTSMQDIPALPAVSCPECSCCSDSRVCPSHPFPPSSDVPQPCHPVDPPSATSQAQSASVSFCLCRLQLPLLQGILTFLLLWLQDPLVNTLLHLLLSPRLLFLSWIPASLRNLSLAHLG